MAARRLVAARAAELSGGRLWFLNPLSWQFLFVIGIAATVRVRKGGRLPACAFWTGLSAAYLLGALIWVYSPMWGQDGWRGLPLFLAGFDKTFLALPRLLDILALAYLLMRLPMLSKLARTSRDNPLPSSASTPCRCSSSERYWP
jgi:hypothetical protein